MKTATICMTMAAIGAAGLTAPISAHAAPPEAVIQAQEARVSIKVSVPAGGEALTYTDESGETVTLAAGSVGLVPVGAKDIAFPKDTVITVTVKQFGTTPIVQSYLVQEGTTLSALTPAAVIDNSTAFSIFKEGLTPEDWERGEAIALDQLLRDIETGAVNPVNRGNANKPEKPEKPEKPTKPTKPKPPVRPATDRG